MLRLRKATKIDEDFLFNLKNDPIVLQYSYVVRKPINRRKYSRWLDDVLEDPQSMLYIIEEDGVSIGDVRLDIDEEIEISIHLAEKHRHRGNGDWTIKEICKIAQPFQKPIISHIVDGNIPSMKLFIKNNFSLVDYYEGPPIGLYKFMKKL